MLFSFRSSKNLTLNTNITRTENVRYARHLLIIPFKYARHSPTFKSSPPRIRQASSPDWKTSTGINSKSLGAIFLKSCSLTSTGIELGYKITLNITKLCDQNETIILIKTWLNSAEFMSSRRKRFYILVKFVSELLWLFKFMSWILWLQNYKNQNGHEEIITIVNHLGFQIVMMSNCRTNTDETKYENLRDSRWKPLLNIICTFLWKLCLFNALFS